MNNARPVKFLRWEIDADVCGETAAFAIGARELDLVVTFRGDGAYSWDVVDASNLITSGVANTVNEARKAAENAGRRTFICTI